MITFIDMKTTIPKETPKAKVLWEIGEKFQLSQKGDTQKAKDEMRQLWNPDHSNQ